MGSRQQNFYNRLVQRYGFDEEARRIQELYLSGRKDEAAAAIPARLIDLVSLCGPADVVRERLDAFRQAGVGTLLIAPMEFGADQQVQQLRVIAELAGV
jgi:alkanesulfonate monooxygenase SsuD/methylene tetrahydromethanopterin reductase-like flavin-dependent oxidoreductase (luciferase family)